MLITIENRVLLNKMMPFLSISSTRSTLPILSYTRLSVENSVLGIFGTDLEVYMSTKVELESEWDKGTVCVPTKLFCDALKKIKEGEIRISTHPTKELCIVLEYPNGKAEFMGADPAFAPNQEAVREGEKSFNIDSIDFLDSLGRAASFASNDNMRPMLSGVHVNVHSPSKLDIVASDGYKLLLTERKIEWILSDDNTFEETKVLIPAKGIAAAKALLGRQFGDMKVTLSKNHIDIACDNDYVGIRLVDANFPNYSSIIPSEFVSSAILDRLTLLQVASRVRLFSNQTSGAISLLMKDGTLEMTSKDIEGQMKSSETMVVDYSGDSAFITLKANTLQEAVSSLTSPDIELRYIADNKPLVILGDEVLCLVMPVSV